MTHRDKEINAFLMQAGWGDAAREAVPGDASTRRYIRLARGGDLAVLMDAPPASESAACPPNATASQRAALGYNALARLAGPAIEAFSGTAQALTARGFSAPHILAADLPAGLLLLEDLGDDLYASVLDAPGGAPDKEAQLYEAAIDCLAAIYRSSFDPKLQSFGQSWLVQDYDEAALLAETGLLSQWYLPHRLARAPLGDDETRALDAAWLDAFEALHHHARGLTLRDFHAQNIFWLPQREATARVGLIDFQDALMGHPSYDLVSLIEDARRDVDPGLARPLIARFCQKAGIADDARFAAAYAVMGAQRNAKILGIFVRLAKRDGKARYLDLLPRVEAHFEGNLRHPALAGVKAALEALK